MDDSQSFLQRIDDADGVARWVYAVPREVLFRWVPNYDGSSSAKLAVQRQLIHDGAEDWVRQLIPKQMGLLFDNWVAWGPKVESDHQKTSAGPPSNIVNLE